MNAKIKQTLTKQVIILTLFSLFSISITAQVTIGSGIEPAKGALLDLKEKDATDGTSTATKGVVFPRVELSNLTSLEPLLSAADAANTAEKLIHKGTVVYNVTVSADLQDGLYYWDGDKWNYARSSEGGSGNDPNAWKITGNATTDPSTNYIGTSDNQPLMFRTNGIEALRITADRNVGIGVNTNPTNKLEVSGTSLLGGNTIVGGMATVGVDEAPARGVLMDLKNQNETDGIENSTKGIKFPRVALQSLNSMVPLLTSAEENQNNEKQKHKGTIVYNTTVNTEFNQGVFYWDGTKWGKLTPETPKKSVSLVTLAREITTYAASTSGRFGIQLPFENIIIPEDGSYAFSFRLYGELVDLPEEMTRCVFYIRLMDHVTEDFNVRDIAEIDFVAFKQKTGNESFDSNYTYSVTLAGDFTAGQRVVIAMGHASGYPAWKLSTGPDNTHANRTSLIWWKL